MDFRQFYISRARRILPLYYTALVTAMLVPTITVNEYSIGNLIGHFLLLHGFNPYWINTIMGVGWYVGDLAIFYLICPLLFKAIKDLKSALLGLTTSIVISSLSLVLWNQLNVDNATGLEMFFNTFFFIHQLPVLCLGIVLYYIIKQIECGELSIRAVLFFSTAIALGFLTAFVLSHLNKKLFTSSLASGIVFSLIFLLCYSIRKKFLVSVFTPLASLGKHSYGIYLFHFTIISCLLLIQHNEHKMMQWILFYCISVVISAVVSLALERIEKILLPTEGRGR